MLNINSFSSDNIYTEEVSDSYIWMFTHISHFINSILMIEVNADSKIVESFYIAAFDDFNKTIFCDKYF